MLTLRKSLRERGGGVVEGGRFKMEMKRWEGLELKVGKGRGVGGAVKYSVRRGKGLTVIVG